MSGPQDRWGALRDVGPVVALTVLSAVQLAAAPPLVRPALVAVLAVAAVLPLALRRRRPLTAAVLVGAAVVGLILVGGETPTFGSFLAVSVCFYSAARHGSGIGRWGALAVLAVAVGVETCWRNSACVTACRPSSWATNAV